MDNMTTALRTLRAGTNIQVRWPLHLSVAVGNINGTYSKKRKCERWFDATVTKVEPNSKVTLQYPSSDIFPGGLFYAVLHGNYLEHVYDGSGSLLRAGFKSFMLPWRMSKRSASGSLSLEGKNFEDDREEQSCAHVGTTNAPRTTDFYRKWSEANERIDELLRLVQAQSALFSRVVGEIENDATSKKLLADLRDGILRVAQRTMVIPRRSNLSKQSEEEKLKSVQHYYVGILSAQTPCTLTEFEEIAKSVRRLAPSAEFDPVYALTQQPSEDLECALISLQSLKDMCTCIQLRSCTDKMALLTKSKKATKRSPTPYIRVAGTVVTDGMSSTNCDDFPFVFLPGYGNSELDPPMIVTVLHRPTSRFDYRNNEYESKLERRTVSAEDARLLAQMKQHSKSSCSSDICAYDDVFSFRWRRHPALSRIWSYETHRQKIIAGSLQLCIPYIIVHGHAVSKEFTSLLSTEVKVDIVS